MTKKTAKLLNLARNGGLEKLQVVAFQLSASQIEVVRVSVGPHQARPAHLDQAEAAGLGTPQPVPAPVGDLEEPGEEEAVEEGVEDDHADAVVPLQLLHLVAHPELFHAFVRIEEVKKFKLFYV